MVGSFGVIEIVAQEGPKPSLDAVEDLAAFKLAVDGHLVNALLEEVDVVQRAEPGGEFFNLVLLIPFDELLCVLFNQEVALGGGEEGGHGWLLWYVLSMAQIPWARQAQLLFFTKYPSRTQERSPRLS